MSYVQSPHEAANLLCHCWNKQTTVCTLQCGHCGGCMRCELNVEGTCHDCIPLNANCTHASFNPSHPECTCDDGETTMCFTTCDECGGCLDCPLVRQGCNCSALGIKCSQAHFEPRVDDMPPPAMPLHAMDPAKLRHIQDLMDEKDVFVIEELLSSSVLQIPLTTPISTGSDSKQHHESSGSPSASKHQS